MYFNIDETKLTNQNTAIIGDRNADKVTTLKKLVHYFYKKEYVILLFGSKTESNGESLLAEAAKKYPFNLLIESPEEKKIRFDFSYIEGYPYLHVANTYYTMYLFDTSNYLDNICNNDVLEHRESLLSYYKQLLVQEMSVMFKVVYRKRCIVIIDEIECNNHMRDVIARYNVANIPVIVSANKVQSLGSSRPDFEVIHLK